MASIKAVTAAHDALIYYGGDPGPMGHYALARVLDQAVDADARDSRDSAAREAIREAQRRAALWISLRSRG